MGRLQTSIGLVTGTDIVGTVDQLIAISAKPRDRLVTATKALQTQQKAIADLTALVIGVQISGNKLTATSQYQARSGTSSNPAAISVTAAANAEIGTIRARATQLAATHTVQSSGLATSSTTALGLTGEIQIRSGGFINGSAALGDLNQGRGIERGSIRITDRAGNSEEIDLSQASSIEDVLNTINHASNVRIQATTVGDSIKLTDLSGSTAGNLRVDEVGSGETAADLGLHGVDTASSSFTGTDIYGNITDTQPTGLQGVALAKLGGGNGLGSLTTININTTDGTITSVNLSNATSTQDIVRLINESGAAVEAKLNDSATGFRLRDLSGGSLNAFSVSSTDSTAAKIGLAKTSASRIIDGNDLQKQFVDSTTKLSALRQGRGVDTGTLLLTNSAGQNATVDLTDADKISVGDLISRINANSVSITASINSTGDGIALVDSSGGSHRFTVTDTASDTTAADLGLKIDSTDVTVGNSTVQKIDARQADTIKVSATDSLTDIVNRINTSGHFATATIVTGADGKQGIAFKSARGGDIGRLSVSSSGFDLGQHTTTTGKDAILEVQQADGSTQQLKSQDGVFSDVTPGVSLTAKDLSTDFVSVNVGRDTSTALTNVKAFVAQYNKLFDKLATLTAFDADTQVKGDLFGTSEALRVETTYTRLLSGTIAGAGSIKSIGELGLSYDDTGHLLLDETKLTNKLTNSSDAVTEFLTKDKTGLAAKLSSVADRIAGTNHGILLGRTSTLATTIERNNKQTDALNVRLNQQRDRLLKQYYDAETAISKLQSNQSVISQIQTSSSSSSSN